MRGIERTGLRVERAARNVADDAKSAGSACSRKENVPEDAGGSAPGAPPAATPMAVRGGGGIFSPRAISPS
jgi:hypothetical protein